MITIQDSIAELLKTDSVRKSIRIKFPNGEREDIKNSELDGQSLKFTENLCSRDNLSFGLCESNVLEFKTANVGNIKGSTIDAEIDIDATDSKEVEQVEKTERFTYHATASIYDIEVTDASIGQGITIYSGSGNIDWYSVWVDDVQVIGITTASRLSVVISGSWITGNKVRITARSNGAMYMDYVADEWVYPEGTIIDSDLDYPYYPINFGRFVVDTCDRDSAFLQKRHVVAYSKNSIQFPTTEYEIAKQQTPVSVNQPYQYEALNYAFSNMPYPDISGFNFGSAVEFQNIASRGNYSDVFGNQGAITLETASIRYNFNTFDKANRLYYTNEIVNPKASIMQEINNAITRYAVRKGYTVNTESSIFAAITRAFNKKYQIESAVPSYGIIEDSNTVIYPFLGVDTRNYPKFSNIIDIPTTIKLTFDDGTVLGPISLRENISVREIVAYQYPHIMLTIPRGKTTNSKFLVKEPVKQSADQIVGYIELMGRFGKFDRTGVLKLVSLNTDPVKRYLKSEYSSLRYDDEPTRLFGKIECNYTDTNDEQAYASYNIVENFSSETYATYDLTNNYIVQNSQFSEADIQLLLEQFALQVRNIQYMPVELKCIGYPQYESGDGIEIETDEEIVKTVILTRTLTGIQSLKDTIAANGNNETSYSQGSTTGGGTSGIGESQVMSVNGQTGVVELTASDVGALPDTTTIPRALADLTDDATHRTVTDEQIAKWNEGGGGGTEEEITAAMVLEWYGDTTGLATLGFFDVQEINGNGDIEIIEPINVVEVNE